MIIELYRLSVLKHTQYSRILKICLAIFAVDTLSVCAE